jgi:Zn-dependent peptidase ImmA (M78 family)
MSTWTQAHRIANLAAAQAHRDLGIDTNCFPIDVYRAIEDAGMVLMWRPLPRLFGWYFAGPRPGILLNNQLDYGSQRHTAAHELGHHILGHGTRADLDLDPLTDRRAGWTEVEKTAEAFASWFLMPRPPS